MPEADADAASYDAFAPFYDAFTAASDYDVWTRHVLALARDYGLRGTRLLDLACGTGNSFIPFLREGFEVTGCDASAAMLAEAARKAPEAKLVHADIRRLPTLDRFHLVTCFDDSLNYLMRGTRPGLGIRVDGGQPARGGPRHVRPEHLARVPHDLRVRQRVGSRRRDLRVARRLTQRRRGRLPGGCRDRDLRPARARALRTHHERARSAALPPRSRRRRAGRAGLDCIGVHGVSADGALVPDADESRLLKVLYVARPAEGGVDQ